MAKRRANGEGNIRKRSDGRWEGRYTAGYDPVTGKRIIKNVLGKTQGEVKQKLAKVLEETKDLDVIRAEEYTVATWLKTWYEKNFPVLKIGNRMVVPKEKFITWVEQNTVGGST